MKSAIKGIDIDIITYKNYYPVSILENLKDSYVQSLMFDLILTP